MAGLRAQGIIALSDERYNAHMSIFGNTSAVQEQPAFRVIGGLSADALKRAVHAKADPRVEEALHAFSEKPLSYRAVKRIFDLGLSAGVVVVGSIPAALLSAVIVVESKGSPFYTQTRVGKGGKLFKLYKFRTMFADANDLEKYLTEDQIAQWIADRKVKDDPRVTKIGHFLRKTSLDELPQFLNVLQGHLSIIGPRAITPGELEWYGDDAGILLSVTPGITGLWQSGKRNAARYDTGERQQIELTYVKEADLAMDARIVVKTIQTILAGKGE